MIRADVSKKTEIDGIVKKVTGELWPVGILVNNAAIPSGGRGRSTGGT